MATVPGFRSVLYTIGLLLAGLGAVMMIPAAIDGAAGDTDWAVFTLSGIGTAFFGITLVLAFRGDELPRLGLRGAFLLTVLTWCTVTVFSAIPFLFSNLDFSVADAVFEAVSGITTTGSTVIVGLDAVHPGILMWRSLLQWFGGVGFIVLAIALLPLLQVGGMQLFQTESSDRSEKVLPRLRQIALATCAIYVTLTAVSTLALWAVGMTLFDAVNHAMAAISTGGYSTSDASVGHFANWGAEAILVLTMILGGTTFTVQVRAWRGNPAAFWRDSQVRWFLAILGLSALAIAIWTSATVHVSFGRALWNSIFSVVSVVTTTGFVTVDYSRWGSFAVAAFFFLTFVGGCTGSTAGGIKIFRFQVLYAMARQQLRRMLAPHRVTVPMVEGKIITEPVAISVLTFFFFYVLTYAVLSVVLALFGVDLVTALSGAATAIANVGPGLGPIIGPAGNFSSLPDSAKWALSIGMLLGRLEFLTVLVLLLPSFWRS